MGDRVCVVAGVGPGNGTAFTRRFAAAGYQVAMLARTRERLAALEVELSELDRSLEAAVAEENATREQRSGLASRLEQAKTALARATEGATAWKERVAAHAQLVTERRSLRLRESRRESRVLRGVPRVAHHGAAPLS